MSWLTEHMITCFMGKDCIDSLDNAIQYTEFFSTKNLHTLVGVPIGQVAKRPGPNDL